MIKILLVEDDISLGETLYERLAKEGYKTSWKQNFQDSITFIKNEDFDLAILDINLPDGDGFSLAQEIKKNKSIPIVFMTALNTAENRLAGYELGADEFIPKPFHLKELLIRLTHVIKNHIQENIIVLDHAEIDLKKMTITNKKQGTFFVPTKEFKTLKLLIDQAPEPVHRDEILNLVWGEDKFPSHRTVDNVIVRLRDYLEDQEGHIIRSVRGVGYQWVAQKRQ